MVSPGLPPALGAGAVGAGLWVGDRVGITGPTAAKSPGSTWTQQQAGAPVPCTTKFTACRSACARSCGFRAWILGSGLLLPMMDAT